MADGPLGSGSLSLRANALLERVRSSLFFVPMLYVVVGGALGIAMVRVDASLDDNATRLPFVLTSTVDSAREVLSIVAGATITVAGVAFSVALLVIQQASSQYSPRVVQSLFRDRFNRRVVGVALGTFTYALMVLRAVRTPIEDGADPVIPNLSVAIGVVLGVVAILAIIAFIDHNAHSMEVSEILHRVTRETVARVERTWPEPPDDEGADERTAPPVPDDAHEVLLRESGWIQQLSSSLLLDLVPDGGTVHLHTGPGRYAIAGTPLCTVSPEPERPDDVGRAAAEAVQINSVRTMQQDPAYGIRQLADVALRALSPGVNDPTTARDAIFHLADVLQVALNHGLPDPVECDDRGRVLVHLDPPTHAALIGLAFDEVRRAAASQPAVGACILEALHVLHDAPGRRPEHCELLRQHADRVLASTETSQTPAAELREVRRCHERWFSRPPGTSAAELDHVASGRSS